MKGKQLLVPGALLSTLPSALALDTGMISRAMGTAWSAVGAMFSWAYVDSSPEVRLGIIQAAVFLSIFIILHRVIKTYVAWADNKTAGVIGFSVAVITVWLTPNGVFTYGIIAVAFPLGLSGFFAMLAFQRFGEKFWRHLIGFGILVLDTYAVSFLVEELYPAWDFGSVDTFVMTTMEVWFIILLILCIVKFFMIFLSGEGGLFRGIGGGNNNDGGNDDGGNNRNRRRNNGEGEGETPEERAARDAAEQARREAEQNAPNAEAAEAARNWPYTNLDPTHSGNMQFRVIDEQGRPIPGARVTLAPNRGGPQPPPQGGNP